MAETKLKTQAMDPTTRLASKIITATRDLTAASGDVAYTGVGFVPTAIICISGIENTTYSSIGMADSSKTNYERRTDSGTALALFNNNIVTLSSGAGGFQQAIVKSYDSDGFTLTWTKTSSPTGTAQLRFLCFR